MVLQPSYYLQVQELGMVVCKEARGVLGDMMGTNGCLAALPTLLTTVVCMHAHLCALCAVTTSLLCMLL